METKFSAFVIYSHPSHAELRRIFKRLVGNFAKANCNIIDCCKEVSCESSEVIFEYFHFGNIASTDEVFANMNRLGLRPALFEELLAFSKKYPDEQLQFPIVALGSVFNFIGTEPMFAFLSERESKRSLNMCGGLYFWRGHCRFLVVRK